MEAGRFTAFCMIMFTRPCSIFTLFNIREKRVSWGIDYFVSLLLIGPPKCIGFMYLEH